MTDNNYYMVLLYSRFVYPVAVMFVIATLTFPKGLGQFMAGEVRAEYFVFSVSSFHKKTLKG